MVRAFSDHKLKSNCLALCNVFVSTVVLKLQINSQCLLSIGPKNKAFSNSHQKQHDCKESTEGKKVKHTWMNRLQ